MTTSGVAHLPAGAATAHVLPSVMQFAPSQRRERGAETAYSPGADSRPPSAVTVPMRAVPG
jgi:hypothetical protein